MSEALADYPAFAPEGWTVPSEADEEAHLRVLLADPGVWACLAEVGGVIVAQIMLVPASCAARPVDEPGLVHLRNLFVVREHWGGGLATAMHAAAVGAAAQRGYTAMRLFVATGQTRARRFYAREGWADVGAPFHDPRPNLELQEMRRDGRLSAAVGPLDRSSPSRSPAPRLSAYLAAPGAASWQGAAHDRHERVPAVRARRRDRGDRARDRGRAARRAAAVDVVRADVVRFKISRGGAFDETPTFAALRRPARRSRPTFTVEHGEGAAVVRTGALVVTLGLDPFRLDVHRPDGSPWSRRRSTRTAGRRPTSPATTPGRCAGAAGRRTRSTGSARRRARTTARAATSRSGTPTCSTTPRPRSSSRAGTTTTRARTRRAPSSTRTTSPSPSSTTTRSRRARSARRSSTTAIAPSTTSRVRRVRRSTSRAGSTRSTSSPGPDLPGMLEAYTWLTGRMALPPLWALGYHQCRWFKYTQDAVEALGARHRELGPPVRRPVARHRLHGRLPRLHLGRGGVPGPAGDARAAARAGPARDHDHRPGREGGARLRDLRPRGSSATSSAARRAATSTSARSGRATPRSPTSSPRRRARGGASSTPPTCSRASRASGTT